MRGSGTYAEQIAAMFKAFKKKLGLDRGLPGLDPSQLRPPVGRVVLKKIRLENET